MPISSARRQSLKRRRAFRSPIPLLLVVAEGKVTEKQYLSGLRQHFCNRTLRFEFSQSGAVPLTLVESAVLLKAQNAREAKRLGDPNSKYDEVWCVFDVDDHPNVAKAVSLATREGVGVAISNPCVELWLLLHFEECTAHIERDDAERCLRRHLPRYAKHVSFADFVGGYGDAVRRAGDLDAMHARKTTPGENPSSGLYHLTERVRTLGKAPSAPSAHNPT